MVDEKTDESTKYSTTEPLTPESTELRYWRRYLEKSEPCHVALTEQDTSKRRFFGSIDRRRFSSIAPKRVQSIGTKFDSHKRLRELCEKNGIVPANVLQTAWALVLRTYLNSETTCFGCQTLSYRDTSQKPISTHSFALINRWSRNRNAIQAAKDIGNDFTQSMLHQGCTLAQINQPDPSGRHKFNTALFTYHHEHTKVDLPNCQTLQCGHDVRELEEDRVSTHDYTPETECLYS